MSNNIWNSEQSECNVWKGVASGLVAGLVASWTMNQFQALWSKLSGDEKDSERAHPPRQSGTREATERDRPNASGEEQASGEHETPATVKIASAISEEVFDHKLKKTEKEAAGMVMHYAFGTTTAGVYGAMAELVPEVSVGAGIPFGAAVWLLADEVSMPLLGLSKSPTAYPLSKHGYSLVSHIVYGATAECVRRGVRSIL